MKVIYIIFFIIFSNGLYSQCADIYFLRGKLLQEETNVKIFSNDEKLLTLKLGSRFKVKFCDLGEKTFNLSTKSNQLGYFGNKTLQIEEGKTYYLNITVPIGVDEPILRVMSQGKGEKFLKNNRKFNHDLEEIQFGKSESVAHIEKIERDNEQEVTEQVATVNPTQITSPQQVILSPNVPSYSEFWQPITDSLGFKRYCPSSMGADDVAGNIESVVVNKSNTFLGVLDQSRRRCSDYTNNHDKLLRSRNGGKSWEDISLRVPYVEDIYRNSPRHRNSSGMGAMRVYVAGGDFYLIISLSSILFNTDGALLKSSDEGNTWEIVTEDIYRSNVIISPCGRVFKHNSYQSSSFINNGNQLLEQTLSDWNFETKNWNIVRTCKADEKNRYKTGEYIFSKGSSESNLNEYKRIKQYRSDVDPYTYKVNPAGKYFYEESIDKGKSWRKIQLPYDHRFWIRPWDLEQRSRIKVDNILWVREANSSIWKPLYQFENYDYFSGFKVGADGYGYVTKDGKIYKSKSVIFRGNDCEGREEVKDRFGTTVITHGIMPPNFINASDDNWVKKMAEAILTKAGQGIIYYCEADEGRLEVVKSKGNNPERGEKVILFDWSKYSILLEPVYAEVTAEKLYLSLAHLNESIFKDTLKDVHFIGEGFGAIVNCLAVERLSQLNSHTITIDQMTHIAPREYDDHSNQIKIWNDIYTDIYQSEYYKLPFYENVARYGLSEFFSYRLKKIEKALKNHNKILTRISIIADEVMGYLLGSTTEFETTGYIEDIDAVLEFSGIKDLEPVMDDISNIKYSIAAADFIYQGKEYKETGYIIPYDDAQNFLLEGGNYDFYPDAYTHTITESTKGNSDGGGYAFSRLNGAEREVTNGTDFSDFDIEKDAVINGKLNKYFKFFLPAWDYLGVVINEVTEIKDGGLLKHQPIYFPKEADSLAFSHRGNGNFKEGNIFIDFYDVNETIIQGASRKITVKDEYLSFKKANIPIHGNIKGKVGSFSIYFKGIPFDESRGDAGIIIDNVQLIASD